MLGHHINSPQVFTLRRSLDSLSKYSGSLLIRTVPDHRNIKSVRIISRPLFDGAKFDQAQPQQKLPSVVSTITTKCASPVV